MFKKKPPAIRRTPESSNPTKVFSYYSSRSGADTPRARYEPPSSQKRGLERLKHVPTAVALVVIVGSLLYASLLDTQPRIMISASETGKPLQRPVEVYEDFVAKQLSGSILNRSKLTINTEPITASLQREFPEVANAVVTIPLVGHRPVVHIAVSSPAFVLATTSGAYYLSADGVPLVRVADVAHQIEGLATVSDETGLSVTVGKQILPEDTVGFISEVIAQFKATNTPVERIILPLEANELQVRLPNQPYVIRFNTLEDARTQVGTFLAVKDRLEGSGQVPKEYIDVRVLERAYYK